MGVLPSPSAEGLILVLSSLTDAYTEMSALSESLRNAIISNSVEDVTAITDKQRTLLGSVNEIETKRERLTQRMAQACGEDVAAMDIERIASLADEKQSGRIREAGRALREAVQRQSALNDVNMTLMRVTLGVTESVISALTQTDTLNNIYTSGGAQSQPVINGKRDFFSREI